MVAEHLKHLNKTIAGLKDTSLEALTSILVGLGGAEEAGESGVQGEGERRGVEESEDSNDSPAQKLYEDKNSDIVAQDNSQDHDTVDDNVYEEEYVDDNTANVIKEEIKENNGKVIGEELITADKVNSDHTQELVISEDDKTKEHSYKIEENANKSITKGCNSRAKDASDKTKESKIVKRKKNVNRQKSNNEETDDKIITKAEEKVSHSNYKTGKNYEANNNEENNTEETDFEHTQKLLISKDDKVETSNEAKEHENESRNKDKSKVKAVGVEREEPKIIKRKKKVKLLKTDIEKTDDKITYEFEKKVNNSNNKTRKNYEANSNENFNNTKEINSEHTEKLVTSKDDAVEGPKTETEEMPNASSIKDINSEVKDADVEKEETKIIQSKKKVKPQIIDIKKGDKITVIKKKKNDTSAGKETVKESIKAFMVRHLSKIEKKVSNNNKTRKKLGTEERQRHVEDKEEAEGSKRD